VNKDKQKLSVVIASVNGFPIIGECLDSLHEQCGVGGVEVVVANRCKNGTGEVLKQKYPWIKFIEAPPQTPIPHLRAMAIRETTGDIVAVLEDHCIVDTDWAKRMIEAHCSDYPVIAGPLRNVACDKLVDWAAFFCEYSQFMYPMPDGEVENIPGNNVSYKRWILKRFEVLIKAGVWDSILHEKIKSEHLPLRLISSITVGHKMSASLCWFMIQKFHFARSFAGIRFASSSYFRRVLYSAGSFFLPFIVLRRIFLQVWRRGTCWREFLLSMPFLILLLFSWGIGEAVGYILGAGSSEAKVA